MPFFTGLAQLSGNSDKEIQEAIMVSSQVARDVVYMAGVDYDLDQFKRELQQISEHVQKTAAGQRR